MRTIFFLERTPVCLDLGFAGTAKKTDAAALTLEMGPTANKPAFL